MLYSQAVGPLNSQANDNSAPSLVLVHGLFGSSDNLAVIRRHFESSMQVLSVDLPDHGKSPRSEQFNFDNAAQQLINTIVAAGIKHCYIVAHSLGGKIAMRAASLAPDLVKKLVVMDIAPVTYTPRHHNVINGLQAVKLSSLTGRKDAQQALSQYVQDAGTQSFLLKSLYQENGLWQWRFNLPLLVRDYALLSDWPFSGELYTGPVTFIVGKQSDYVLPEHQSTIKQQFPNASAKIIDAGHWLHAEKPQLVNRTLTRILLEQD